jgi:hypothetical protein
VDDTARYTYGGAADATPNATRVKDPAACRIRRLAVCTRPRR